MQEQINQIPSVLFARVLVELENSSRTESAACEKKKKLRDGFRQDEKKKLSVKQTGLLCQNEKLGCETER